MQDNYWLVKKRLKAPVDCQGDQIWKLRRSYLWVGNYIVCADSHQITLREHHKDSPVKQEINLPPKVFKQLAKWCLRPQVLKDEL